MSRGWGPWDSRPPGSYHFQPHPFGAPHGRPGMGPSRPPWQPQSYPRGNPRHPHHQHRQKRGWDGNGFEEWGGYMAAKKAKLQGQFQERQGKNAASNSTSAAIFSVPSADELKRIMMTHGGTYHHYYSRHHTTHIVATNLPDSKVRELKGEKIVHPDWITHSLKEGRLLDDHPYQLYVRPPANQATINFPKLDDSAKGLMKAEIPGAERSGGEENADSASSRNTGEKFTGVSGGGNANKKVGSSTKANTDVCTDVSADEYLGITGSHKREAKSESLLPLVNMQDQGVGRGILYVPEISKEASGKPDLHSSRVTESSEFNGEGLPFSGRPNILEKCVKTGDVLDVQVVNPDSFDEEVKKFGAGSSMDSDHPLKGNCASERTPLEGVACFRMKSKDEVCVTAIVKEPSKKEREAASLEDNVNCKTVEEGEGTGMVSKPLSSTTNEDYVLPHSNLPQNLKMTSELEIPQKSELSLADDESGEKHGKEGGRSQAPAIDSCDNEQEVMNLNEDDWDWEEEKVVIMPKSPETVKPSTSHSTKSSKDANFLSEFYSHSRLHHIATMGAIFKQYVDEKSRRKNPSFPGLDRFRLWLQMQPERVKEEDIESRVIMHIDMDCFFVSVGLRNNPDLRGKPVAVTHSKSRGPIQPRGQDIQYELEYYQKKTWEKGKKVGSSMLMDENPGEKANQLFDDTCSTAFVSSCSYEARAAGVCNGMFLGEALKLCPQLKTITYDFESYKQVSYLLYDTLAEFTHDLEAVSCDEMYVDCKKILKDIKATPLQFASFLRQEIKEKSGCPCSAGLGPNMLVARLATKVAKPDGQYHVPSSQVGAFIANQKANDLPGVGWKLSKRLDILGIKTCLELQKLNEGRLQEEFGAKSGTTLYHLCRGVDNRAVTSTHQRKSVSAEVNYGIRFTKPDEVQEFLNQLSAELASRLSSLSVKARTFTLKLKVRALDAPVEPVKYMGHGVCDNIARSVTLGIAAREPSIIAREVWKLHCQLSAIPSDLRGIGIQATRLEADDMSSSSSSVAKQQSIRDLMTANAKPKKFQPLTEVGKIDFDVLAQLPPDIQDEIHKEYHLPKKTKVQQDGKGPIPKPTENIKIGEQEKKKAANLCGETETDALRELLHQWVASGPIPQEEDVQVLSSFLCDLIQEGELEKTLLLLKRLHREVRKLKEERQANCWIEAYSCIVSRVQAQCLVNYNATLDLSE
ncbi:unnamed protein product [Darwinula stevensoni]|uniref:DNA repair protein REV1 n=1 Tax=Darwinula stevensoni TaxID=69355 RepID=A0A7R9AEW8_9CRUS|nr:unnamed protein product [Darwinula stevensoni]CAG0902746.1 unnamed protein product [Darwinula stevensoni]